VCINTSSLLVIFLRNICCFFTAVAGASATNAPGPQMAKVATEVAMTPSSASATVADKQMYEKLTGTMTTELGHMIVPRSNRKRRLAPKQQRSKIASCDDSDEDYVPEIDEDSASPRPQKRPARATRTQPAPRAARLRRQPTWRAPLASLATLALQSAAAANETKSTNTDVVAVTEAASVATTKAAATSSVSVLAATGASSVFVLASTISSGSTSGPADHVATPQRVRVIEGRKKCSRETFAGREPESVLGAIGTIV